MFVCCGSEVIVWRVVFRITRFVSVMIDVVSAGPPGDDVSPELDRLIRQRGRDLRLRKVDQQKAVKTVNHLIDSLLEFLKNNEDQPFFRNVSVLTSGSYYEMVKVRNMNEY